VRGGFKRAPGDSGDAITYWLDRMSNLEPVPSAPAIVLGGGIAGLAAARLLARHYPRVLVLERDLRPDVARAEEAFSSWRRGGVPQLRHSHAFLARLRLVLLAHMPDVLDRLRASGVRARLLDAGPTITHDQVNRWIGATGEQVETPAVVAFVRSCRP